MKRAMLRPFAAFQLALNCVPYELGSVLFWVHRGNHHRDWAKECYGKPKQD